MNSLTRKELLALPPVTNLATLGKAFGLSDPTIRERYRRGELEPLGIRVLKFGQQYRVPTADILRVLGIEPDAEAADPASSEPAANAEPPGKEARDGDDTA